MALIKKIVLWIIALIKKLFSTKNSNSKTYNSSIDDKYVKNARQKFNNSTFNETLPSYMMISDENKESLINRITNLKSKLLKVDYKKIEIEAIDEIINGLDYPIDDKVVSNIHNYIENTDIERINSNRLKTFLNNVDEENKEKILTVVDTVKNKYEKNKEIIEEFDNTIEYIKDNEISYAGMDAINKEIEINDKDNSNKEKSSNDNNDNYDKDIINKIKNWDKRIIEDVKLEYQKINYITISTTIVDKMFNKYKKIEEDYQKHHFNKAYYDREINKLKSQIYYLCDIKNKKIVFEEIQKLKKDLYTKSKDKYDILYNNEVFMDIEKKCDDLLNKVNQKVVDIKKEQNEKQSENKKDKDKQKKKRYLDNIILRFQDLELSREIIAINQYDVDLSKDVSLYINDSYHNFINGIDLPFNFQRNKAKTELVVLYNNLNNVISKNKNESFIPIDHINFRIEDLIEATLVRMREVNTIVDCKKVENVNLVEEKINDMQEVYLEKSKVLTKNKVNLYK